MREMQLSTLTNISTNQVFPGQFRENRFSIDVDAQIGFSDVAPGDILAMGSTQAITLFKESVNARHSQYVALSCLPLTQLLGTPAGDPLKTWCYPAGLPQDPQAQLLQAAAVPGSNLDNCHKAITALQEAATLLPPGSLADAIQGHIENHKQQYRIILPPGSLAIGQVLSGDAGHLRITAIDRASLKGLEVATAEAVTDQVPAKQNLLTTLKGNR